MPRRIHVAREPDSDEDEALAVARTEQRGQVAMFTWPTPREYFLELADRHAEKAFIPTDIHREMLLDIFMDVMTCMNHSEKLTGILIAKEPHKRWKPNGTEREMHYHIAFKMKEDFAHRGIEHQMRERGVRGFISKSMKGWLQYAEYLLCETPKKPAHCRDANPLLWPNPSGQALEQLRILIKEGQKRTAELNAEGEQQEEEMPGVVRGHQHRRGEQHTGGSRLVAVCEEVPDRQWREPHVQLL